MQTLRGAVKDVQEAKRKMQCQIIDILNEFELEYGVELRLGPVTRYNGSNNATGQIISLNLTVVI